MKLLIHPLKFGNGYGIFSHNLLITSSMLGLKLLYVLGDEVVHFLVLAGTLSLYDNQSSAYCDEGRHNDTALTHWTLEDLNAI